jgi:hypothetical protein
MTNLIWTRSPQRDSRIDSLGNDERSVLILKDILRELNKDVTAISTALAPILEPPVIPSGGAGIGTVPAPIDLQAQVLPLSILLMWSAPDASARLYEIRRNLVLDWNTASFVTRTPSLSVNLAPILAGGYYFLIKTLDSLSNYSPEYDSVPVIIYGPNTPTINVSVIDNNVLLGWNNPMTSFNIDHYNVYKNGSILGTIRATFTSIFETIAGVYTYDVEAVDIAGNVGGKGTVTAQVNTPPDFVLEDRRVSGLNGTRVNVLRVPKIPSLLACVPTETWSQHFSTRSWAHIQAQMTAGYPLYIQPTVLTGSYEEVIDYGTEIQNTIVTITYQVAQIVPQVNVQVKMAFSTDGIAYTPFVIGASQFTAVFRYLKFRLEFTGLSDKALAEYTFVTLTIDVKRELDSGEIIALAGDVGGTQVFFNKVFKDIDSITCTADAIEPIDVIYAFDDIPDPTYFFVFALDTTGNRVTYLISWKARGIV